MTLLNAHNKDESIPSRPFTIKLLAELLDERSEEVNITTSDLKGIRKELRPFSSWKDAKVMSKDYQTEKKCTDILIKHASAMPNARSKLQVMSLAAKNRAEAISEKSDFYPASVSVIATFFATLIFLSSDAMLVRVGITLATPVLVGIFIYIRITTRRQVADLKIIANILDLVEKRVTDKAPDKETITTQVR